MNMIRTTLVLLSLLLHIGAHAQVTVYEHPGEGGPELSSDFTVSVRGENSQEWVRVPVLRCDVDTRQVAHASFAEFDMEGPVVVRIRHACSDTPPVVRPQNHTLHPVEVGDSITELRLERPAFLSVEYGGDRKHNLHLFANPLLREKHSPDELQTINWRGIQAQDVFIRHPRLIYFGPGVHRPKDLPSGVIRIPSNCTVFLDSGAVVKAGFLVDHAENVRIVGRGIIDHALRGVEITYSKKVTVEGLTFLNPAHYTIFGGESEDITVRGIKSFSARPWSDGIDLMCCRRVTISDCFLRTSDDCIALYNHRWWYWGGSEDIEVRRCSLWPDVAHAVNIGSHGDDRNPDGETLQNVRIRDCDILYGREEGVMAINCGDLNHVRDVLFDSIRVEGVLRGRLFDLMVLWSEKYNRAPGCCIDSISFSHIRVHSDCADILRPSRVKPFDERHGVTNVRYNDILIGNRPFNKTTDIE